MKKWFIMTFFLALGMVVYGQPSSEDGSNLEGRARYLQGRARYLEGRARYWTDITSYNLEGSARYWTDITSYRRSLKICNDQIRRNPNDGYAYVNRGNLYFALGDLS